MILATVSGVCLVLLLFYLYKSYILQPTAVQEEAVSEDTVEEEPVILWLELPEVGNVSDRRYVMTHSAEMGGRSQRNYTYFYDEDLYAAHWVAYPLCEDHISSGRVETWAYDPSLDSSVQTSVKSGYGASEPTANYPKNFYARGHQLPNADRGAVPEMQAQTYYSTNMTPQLQNGFNGAIWAKLEAAVREKIPPGDTLYVVTGAAFDMDGADSLSCRPKTIINRNDKKVLPVPKYYWKALLKVVRESGTIVAAETIGFWLPHDDLKGRSYPEYVVSVDQIEEWTGFNLFPALPDSLETSAESNLSWETF